MPFKSVIVEFTSITLNVHAIDNWFLYHLKNFLLIALTAAKNYPYKNHKVVFACDMLITRL